MCDNNQQFIREQASFFIVYSELNQLVTQGLFELLSAYLHVKTPFRVIYDVVSQYDDF